MSSWSSPYSSVVYGSTYPRDVDYTKMHLCSYQREFRFVLIKVKFAFDLPSAYIPYANFHFSYGRVLSSVIVRTAESKIKLSAVGIVVHRGKMFAINIKECAV